MRCNANHHSTRDHSTRDHNTRDHSSKCANSTSNGHQNNGPSKLYPKAGHHTENDRNGRNDGNGTDDASDSNPQRHPGNHRHMNRHRHKHISSLLSRDQSHRLCHVYKRWGHRPVSSHPRTGSGWSHRYIDGYTHRDHGLL